MKLLKQLKQKITLIVFVIVNMQLLANEPKKKTICLNMIVKNESKVIERCLESVLPIIDTWVIVDTGSTDGTQQIIKNYLKNIPGQLYERPWVNFGYNRQEALELAQTKADYILFMDADDKLEFSSDFQMPELSQDVYIAYNVVKNNETYLYPRLIKSNRNWKWEGVVHEYLAYDESATVAILEGVQYLYFHDGARSCDADAPLKDIALLEEQIKIEPENPRNYFYLARSYESTKRPEKALQNYLKRIQMGGNKEELYLSHLKIGVLKQFLQYKIEEVEQSYLEVYLKWPYRSESLYYLACMEYAMQNYEKGYQILKSALELPTKFSDGIFCENWIYDYGLLIQYGYCSWQTGRYLEAINIFKSLLKKKNLPENLKQTTFDILNAVYRDHIPHVQSRVIKLMENRT